MKVSIPPVILLILEKSYTITLITIYNAIREPSMLILIKNETFLILMNCHSFHILYNEDDLI